MDSIFFFSNFFLGRGGNLAEGTAVGNSQFLTMNILDCFAFLLSVLFLIVYSFVRCGPPVAFFRHHLSREELNNRPCEDLLRGVGSVITRWPPALINDAATRASEPPDLKGSQTATNLSGAPLPPPGSVYGFISLFAQLDAVP